MQKIHRYLGFILSAIILLISITGVLLVWKREYLWVTIPAARELPSQEIVLAQVVDNIAASYSPHTPLFVRFYAEGLSIHKVFLTDGRYAWHDQQGHKIQVWHSNQRAEGWLLDLHHRLLLGKKLGLNVVGLTGLLMLPLLLLGLLLWWPRRRSYSANIVPRSGKLSHLRKSHAETGVSVIVPVLIVVVTGIILIYPSGSRALLRDGFSEAAPPLTREITLLNPIAQSDWTKAFNFLQQRFPDGQLHWFSYPSKGSSEFTVGVQENSSWNRMGSSSARFIDSETVIIKHQAEQSRVNQLFDYSYSIHTGKFPTAYRLLLSVTGSLMAWMSFLGLISFFKRRREVEY